MLILPDPDPIDFRLKHVKPNHISCEEHTPIAAPRCTQSTVACFSSPLPNKDGEYVIRKIPPKIMDKMCDRMKAFWVDQPDAKFLHGLFTKYNMKEASLDVRYQLKPTIFPRSYNYEIDCLETRRIRKLSAKIVQDMAFKEVVTGTCGCLDQVLEEVEDDGLRWEARPKLFAKSQTDPCLRRLEFSRVGLPYKTEACYFYNTNYPAPKNLVVVHKFS